MLLFEKPLMGAGGLKKEGIYRDIHIYLSYSWVTLSYGRKQHSIVDGALN